MISGYEISYYRHVEVIATQLTALAGAAERAAAALEALARAAEAGRDVDVVNDVNVVDVGGQRHHEQP
jgi:flavin-binding protein dodecin